MIFHFAGAWINGTFLVLGEGLVIVSLLFEAFFVDETMVDVFDTVLIDQGLADLVGDSRVLDPAAHDSVKMLGKPTKSAVYSPFSFRQILEFVILLPLNLVPFIGVPLFLFLTGYRAGPFHHWRYFKLLDLNKKERKDFVKKRQMKYTLFGMVALLLQLVPVLSMLFLLTSAAGSALWVVQIEKAKRAQESNSQISNEQYRDDPT